MLAWPCASLELGLSLSHSHSLALTVETRSLVAQRLCLVKAWFAAATAVVCGSTRSSQSSWGL
eukprot:3248170-Alexandrium_andersonii.AAC.1